jgi:hypothetical protein
LDADLMQFGEQLIDEDALLNKMSGWESRLRTVSVNLCEKQEQTCAATAASSVSETITRKMEDLPFPLSSTLRPALEFFAS